MSNNVVVNVTANNNTQAGLHAAQGDVSSFSDKVGGMMTGGGVAAAGLFAAGLSSAMDLSSAKTSLETQFGLTGKEAERAGGIAGDVFSDGFGESIGEVTNALGSVQTSIGDLGDFTDKELQQMSKSALGLSKTFDVDVNEATSAVGQMIKTGLVKDANEGFDIITKGMQSVPAALRGDILPTMQEYGTQFRKVGLDGATAMGLISQGLKGGARDADIVADSIKEFSIRAIDGSKLTGEGFKMLGLDGAEMAKKIAKGGKSASKGLDETLDALRNMKDPTQQAAAATALFGTQAEDMGKALFALDPSAAAAASGMDKAKGAAKDLTDKMEASPAQQMDKAMRTLQETLGELLLPVIKTLGEFLSEHKGLVEVLAPIVLALAAAFGVAAIAIWAMNAAFLANPITWVIVAITALIAIILVMITHWDQVKKKIKEVWDSIVANVGEGWEALKENVFYPVRDFFTKKIPGWASTLRRKVNEAWTSITNRIGNAWQSIKDKASDATGWVRQKFDDMVKFLNGLPGRIARGASGMWNFIKEGLKGALNGAIGLINSGIFFINDKLIGNANRIPGVNIPYIPYVPYLATGGLVSGGRGNQVIVGEYGPEMVTLPSGSHVSTASRTAQILKGSGGGGGGELHITLMVGDKRLGDVIIDPLRNAVRTRGGNVQAVLGR